jgi:hypothetical protein
VQYLVVSSVRERIMLMDDDSSFLIHLHLEDDAVAVAAAVALVFAVVLDAE